MSDFFYLKGGQTMTKTINNMTYQEAIQKLSAPFPKKDFKSLSYSGHHYLPIEKFLERFDSVLSPFNYDFITSDYNLIKAGNQDNFIVKGTLTIKNDIGEVVAIRASAGSCDINYPNMKDKDNNVMKDQYNLPIRSPLPTKVSNDIDSACKDAFKRCAKLFGVGHCDEDINSNTKKKIIQNKPDNKQFTVVIKSTWTTLKNGALSAVVESEGKRYDLLIWKEGLAIINECMPTEKFISYYKTNTSLIFKGYDHIYNGKEQLILTGVTRR